MDDIAWALNDGGSIHKVAFEKRRTLAAHLLERVRKEPDHDDAAWVLSQASCVVKPDRYSITGPCEEFVAIAELIRGTREHSKLLRGARRERTRVRMGARL